MMRTPKIALLAAGIALLGVTACSGTVAEDVDAAEGSTPQTVAQACNVIIEPLQQTTEAALENAGSVTDPKQIVTLWNDLAVTFTDATSGIFNQDVKDAAKSVHTALLEVAKQSESVLVDQNVGDVAKLADATTKVQQSVEELQTLCGPAQ